MNSYFFLSPPHFFFSFFFKKLWRNKKRDEWKVEKKKGVKNEKGKIQNLNSLSRVVILHPSPTHSIVSPKFLKRGAEKKEGERGRLVAKTVWWQGWRNKYHFYYYFLSMFSNPPPPPPPQKKRKNTHTHTTLKFNSPPTPPPVFSQPIPK